MTKSSTDHFVLLLKNLQSATLIRKWFGPPILSVAFALCGTVAHAQQPGKIFRIGFLDNSTASGIAVLLEAFRQELSKLGWVEGKNIIIEYRFAEQKNERLPELAADLVRLKVDLIVISGGTRPLAAKSATTTIPIVMASVADPVGAGLVASLARPGGNITGNSSLSMELITKRLEILKDAIPRLSRVGLLRSSGDSILLNPQMKELRPAALALKLNLEDITTQPGAKGLESAFQTAKQKQVGAIMTPAGRPRSSRGKPLGIGYLEDGTAAGSAELLDAFRKQMTQLNWIEGKNLTIEYRYGEGKGVTRLAELAVELVGLKLDFDRGRRRKCGFGCQESNEHRSHSDGKLLAIQLCKVLSASLARPGGNITGLASFADELAGKRVEILKEVLPKSTRIGVQYGGLAPSRSQTPAESHEGGGIRV